MTKYELYLTFHVLLAIVWLGGGLAISLLGWRMSLSNDGRTLAGFAKQTEWLGNHVFVPVSLALLVLGFLLIQEGPWGYDMLWIDIALAGFAVTFLTGALFLGPQAGKIGQLIEAEGVDSPATKAQIRRVLFISRLDLITLYAVAGDMLVKPTGDDGLILGVAVATIVVLAAAVTWAYRSGEPAGTAPEAA